MPKTNSQQKENIPERKRAIQRIWLVRHGLTSWNTQRRYCGHTDIPLSIPGRAQARWLASQLRDVPLSSIYTSDLARAQATAETIATKRAHPVQVIVSTAWREICFGAWEGFTHAEIATAFKHQLSFFTDPEHVAPPGGESLTDVLQRIQPALTELLQRQTSSNGGDIVIVSHGGTLRALLCTLLGMSLSHQWQLRLDHGSLSAIDLSLDEHGVPLATLALLNVQRSTCARYTAHSEAVANTSNVSNAMPVQQETEPLSDV